MNQRFDVNSKHGKLAIIPTDDRHVYVTSNPESGRNFLPYTIRGIDYTVSAHLHKYADGTWHIGEEKTLPWQRLYHSLFMSRRDWTPKNNDVSAPARKTAVADIEAAVVEWIAANGDKLTAAQYSADEATLNRLIAEQRELLDKLAAVGVEITKIQAKMAGR